MGKKRDDLSRAGGGSDRTERLDDTRMELRRETEPFVPGDGCVGAEFPETAQGAVRAGRCAGEPDDRPDQPGRAARIDPASPAGAGERSTYPERPYAAGAGPAYPAPPGQGLGAARSGAVTGNVAGEPLDLSPHPAMRPEGRSPEEIRAEIERTRADMTRTIDALKDQLSPDHLREMARERLHDVEDQAREKIREATIGRAKSMARHVTDRVSGAARHYGSEIMQSQAVRTIGDNPIPAVLAGIGLGWLLVASRRGRRTGGSYYGGSFRSPREYGSYYASMPRMERGSWRSTGGGYGNLEAEGLGESPGLTDRARDTASDLADRARDTASDIADRASRVVDRTREAAYGYADQAADTGARFAHQARDTASQYAHQARDLASRYAGQAQEQAGHAMHAGRRLMRDNPAAIGIAALAVGALVGFVVPETRWEDRYLGGTRDDLVRRARDTGQDYLEQARDVAQEAGQEIMGEVREQFQQVQERFMGDEQGQDRQDRQARQAQQESRGGGQGRQDRQGQEGQAGQGQDMAQGQARPEGQGQPAKGHNPMT